MKQAYELLFLLNVIFIVVLFLGVIAWFRLVRKVSEDTNSTALRAVELMTSGIQQAVNTAIAHDIRRTSQSVELTKEEKIRALEKELSDRLAQGSYKTHKLE